MILESGKPKSTVPASWPLMREPHVITWQKSRKAGWAHAEERQIRVRLGFTISLMILNPAPQKR